MYRKQGKGLPCHGEELWFPASVLGLSLCFSEKIKTELETYLRRMMKRFNKEVQENMHKVMAGRARKSGPEVTGPREVRCHPGGRASRWIAELLSPWCGEERCAEGRRWERVDRPGVIAVGCEGRG